MIGEHIVRYVIRTNNGLYWGGTRGFTDCLSSAHFYRSKKIAKTNFERACDNTYNKVSSKFLSISSYQIIAVRIIEDNICEHHLRKD